jgi:excinuclease UvrABC ATPase subunit
MRNKKRESKPRIKKDNLKLKISSLSELIGAIAKLQKNKKSLVLNILEGEMPSAENILKDSSIKYSRVRVSSSVYRLELLPSQDKRQSLDDIVNDFMSQFEEM